jgi:hypothetical protein
MDPKTTAKLMKIDKIFKILLANITLSIVTFIATSLFTTSLVTRMWTPFDASTGFGFWVLFTYQLVCVPYTAPLVLVMDTLPVFFMVYASCMLQQLCEKLKTTTKANLIECVNFHIKITQIVDEIRAIFSLCFLVRGLFVILILCTTVLSLVVLSDAAVIGKLVSYIVTQLIQAFLSCFYGSEIEKNSENVKNALFHSGWMDEDKECRTMVRVMMEVSKRPMKISAFGVFDVNLEIFGVICKTAYSMYCVCLEFVGK